VFRASPSDQPAIEVDGGSEPVARRFGHLRQATASRSDPAIVEPLQQGVLPVDSTKTFVGPNGTYYDERWRWMEWRGRSRSWNWPAALTFGGWLAYRRFYGFAALYLGWLCMLLVLALKGAPLRLVAALALIVAVIVGLYGNTLYQLRFRRMSWQVAEQPGDHAARLKALAEAGGVDRRAVGIMALAGVILGSLLVALDG
jgi:hypothetical protein